MEMTPESVVANIVEALEQLVWTKRSLKTQVQNLIRVNERLQEKLDEANKTLNIRNMTINELRKKG